MSCKKVFYYAGGQFSTCPTCTSKCDDGNDNDNDNGNDNDDIPHVKPLSDDDIQELDDIVTKALLYFPHFYPVGSVKP